MSSTSPLVLFDFNGVIADDEPVHQEMLQKVLAEEGITVTDAEYHDIYLGFDDKGCFEFAFEANGRPIDARKVAELTRRKSAYYDAWIERHLVLFPGAVECVKTLSAEFPVGVVSGALRHEIEMINRVAGLTGCFDFVVAAEDTERCKPDPEGYIKGLAQYNATARNPLEAGQCVVIEDSLAGVASAKNAGMRCVAITHSYRADELTHADRVIDHMSAFTPELVRELAG